MDHYAALTAASGVWSKQYSCEYSLTV
jgi:hypothetical protein